MIYRMANGAGLHCAGWMLWSPRANSGVDAGGRTALRFVFAIDPDGHGWLLDVRRREQPARAACADPVAPPQFLESPSEINMMYQWLFQNLPKAYSMICCWKRAPTPLARQPRSHLSGRAADRWGGRCALATGSLSCGQLLVSSTFLARTPPRPHSPHTRPTPPRRRAAAAAVAAAAVAVSSSRCAAAAAVAP